MPFASSFLDVLSPVLCPLLVFSDCDSLSFCWKIFSKFCRLFRQLYLSTLVFFLQVLCELEEKAGVILDERGKDIKL
jgi:hypothetical protein